MKIKNVIALLCAILSLAALCAGCAIAVADTSAQLAGTAGSTPGSTPDSSSTARMTAPSSVSNSTATTVLEDNGVELCLEPLSDELRAEIKACYNYTGSNDDPNYVAGMRYYGTFNGYVILMRSGVLASIGQVEIDGRVFKWGTSALVLEAYKDGQVQSLKAVYEAGGITEDNLDTILAVHKAHFSQYHNWDHDA